MIHWAFLFPTFFAGIAAGYGLTYLAARVAVKVQSAIEAGARAFRV